MVNTVHKAFKIRAYPAAEQERQFSRTEGACRYVRNRVLREMDEFHKATGGHKSVIGMSREVTGWKKVPETSWLAEIPSDPIAQELRDLDAAFKNFFAGRARHPRKKRKQFGCSIRFVFDQRHAGKVRAWASQSLALPKLGEIKLAQPERLPPQMPKLVTLTRDGAGRFFVSFAVEAEVLALPGTGVAVGVDIGIKTLAVASDGAEYPNVRALKRKERHLRRQQRRLSRKSGARRGERRSSRYRRQARRVARIHCRIADARRDAAHKASTAIVRNADVIALEDLNVKGMMKNGRLSKAVGDAGFRLLRTQVEYKANWHGRQVWLADRFAPTSKTCSCCGHRLQELDLSVRKWDCPACGAHHDRDVNAAKNILRFAVAGGTGEGGDTPDARGGLNPRRKKAQASLPMESVEARTAPKPSGVCPKAEHEPEARQERDEVS